MAMIWASAAGLRPSAFTPVASRRAPPPLYAPPADAVPIFVVSFMTAPQFMVSFPAPPVVVAPASAEVVPLSPLSPAIAQPAPAPPQIAPAPQVAPAPPQAAPAGIIRARKAGRHDYRDVWMHNYEIARAYAERHGRLPTVRDTGAEAYAIHDWVLQQRHNRMELNPMKVGLLEKLRTWSWGARIAKRQSPALWHAKYAAVAEYVRVHKREPPRHHTDPVHGNLNKWLLRQRSVRSFLTDDQRALISQLPNSA